ncbi:hypothetical protein DER46DRAFT_662120 [Fusarium sp. MPI-SDFR-AT-0072]|nr:hypothetical protein DER46DRAFT_662120 [Fusarium sp. MPI-SDFR-AT-0072]KAI7769569.1 hypothetical protein LZL87_003059 [Fusarium oxysporum]
MSDNTSKPPAISITLSVNPPKFTRGSESLSTPTISITATSRASEPITIFTWHTIFNLRLSQRRKNFICTDLTTCSPLQLKSTKGPKPPQFSFVLSVQYDAYFITLEPNIPITVTYRFFHSTTLGVFKPGHTYELKVREDEEVEWWRYGKEEDVMSPPGQLSPKEGCGDASGPPIRLSHIAPVEFEAE